MISKRLKYLGVTAIAIYTVVVSFSWIAEKHASTYFSSVQNDVSQSARLSIQNKKSEAKHAASWAAKALFSFILPNDQ